MKYCTNCGKEAEDNDSFCGGCGKPFDSSVSRKTPLHPDKPATPQVSIPEPTEYIPPVRPANLSWKDKGGCGGLIIRLVLVLFALCVIGAVIWALDSSFGINKSITEFINDAIPVSCSTVVVRV